jgi:hypothetical protein
MTTAVRLETVSGVIQCGGSPNIGMKSEMNSYGIEEHDNESFMEQNIRNHSGISGFEVQISNNYALSSVVPATECFFASSKLAILKSYGSLKSAFGSPSKGSKSTIRESLTAKTASSSIYLLFRSKIWVTIGL